MPLRVPVLVDALPGREDDVWESLPKLPSVVARRKLQPKFRNCEFLVLVQGDDPDSVAKAVSRELRSLHGVSKLETLRRADDIDPSLVPIVRELEREAAAASGR